MVDQLERLAVAFMFRLLNKEAFGLELETEIISDKQEVMEDNLTGQEPSNVQIQGFPSQRDLPL